MDLEMHVCMCTLETKAHRAGSYS